MGNWLLNIFKKEGAKKEKEVLGKDKKVKDSHLQEILSDDYKRQVGIISNVNLSEKLTELELSAKGEALSSDKWPALYLKNLKAVEKNRKKNEDKLLKMLKGDFAMLKEKVEGEVGSKEKDEGSKKEVNEKDYDTGRKIVSEKKVAFSLGDIVKILAYISEEVGAEEAQKFIGQEMVVTEKENEESVFIEQPEEPWKGTWISNEHIEIIRKKTAKKSKLRDIIKKVALKISPWSVKKDEESGKEVIIAEEEKDKFLTEKSKKKLTKKT